MAENENALSEIQELRNRVAALEAAIAAKPAGTLIPVSAETGAWKTYIPKLMGEKVDPLLGDGRKGENWNVGPGCNGHYVQIGRLVIVKTWNQFSVGAQPGEGQYRMALPVPAELGSDSWLGPTGVAMMHQHSTNLIRNATVILANAEWVSFQLDDERQPVTHNCPWRWADSDGFNTFMVYEAAGDQ